MSDTRQCLCLRVGSQWYGIDVNNVIEVLHLVALAELPLKDSSVLGLMTLRDTVMPVIDLRSQFGMAERQFHLTTPIIAVRTPRGAMGLVADEVDNVERVAEEQLIAYEGPEITWVSRIARVAERLLLLIDVTTMTSVAEAASTAASAKLAPGQLAS